MLSGEKKQKLIAMLNKDILSDNSVHEAIDLIDETNAVEYCILKTKTYCDQAVNAIDELPNDFEPLKTHFNVIANIVSTFENDA